jgi:hypothetical protein
MMHTFKIQPTLPIKYVLGVYRAIPTYPTTQDFMFEVISYIIKVADSKEKIWDPTEIKFSAKTLKYVFGDNMKSEEFVDRIKSILKDLLETEVLSKHGEHIFISQEEFTRYYLTS